jgi:hypothetical protein
MHAPVSRTRLPRRTLAAGLAAAAGLALALVPPAAAQAVDAGSSSLAAATSVGVHNTYQQSAFPYLAQALDAGATLIELDPWDDTVTHEWKVSHDNPWGNNNNCVNASTTADLYTGGRNQDLQSCLDDIRVWLTAHPSANPVMIKLELKAGFNATVGMGPAQLDSLVKAHLGNLVYRPADLLTKADGSRYADLDTAAKAGNWPSRSALQGRALLEVIPGTFEMSNPFDHLWTDVEYSRYLRDLNAAGNVGNAEIFPSVLGAQTGDPRTKYADTTLRPWFAVFDGDAATFVNDGNTEWYNANHYLVVGTDAYKLTPAISSTAPTLAEAQARVAQLAAHGVSFVSTDWTTAPASAVLAQVLPRG